MLDGVVNIESIENNSFGTGFVIDQDEKGVYILTCKHVLDDVITPVVEDVLAKVVAQGAFIDLAVLHVNKLHLKPLPLHINSCDKLDVEVIGFSHFNQAINQKKHIKAKLYPESIELHSTEDDRFYSVRKIQSTEGYNFDRGNSGSPVICQETGKVMAILSNKEGNKIGYAVDIVYLKDVWKDISSTLIEEPTVSKPKIEPISGEKESRDKIEYADPAPLLTPVASPKKSFSFLKYLLSIMVLIGAYIFINYIDTPPPQITPTPIPTPVFTPINSQQKTVELSNDKLHLLIRYKTPIQKGKKVEIIALLQNQGMDKRGSITLSFPQLTKMVRYRTLSNSLKVQVYQASAVNERFRVIYNKNTNANIPTQYPVVETKETLWRQGETRKLVLSLDTPKNLTEFKIKVRAALSISRVVPSNSNNSDQQGFYTKEITIKIVD